LNLKYLLLVSKFNLCRYIVVQACGGEEADIRGGGRAGPKVLGEVKFHIKDLIKTNARQLAVSLTTVGLLHSR
jgi:hypothetical protein